MANVLTDVAIADDWLGGDAPETPSEDLLHDEAPLGTEAAEVGEHALEGVAALEERLELPGRVPGRVAVEANITVLLGADEDVEALAAGVLLDVGLERLQRPVQSLPTRRPG